MRGMGVSARRERSRPAVLETSEPSCQSLALPDHRELSAEVLRGLVDEVARHKGEHRDMTLYSMVPLPT